MTIASEWNVSSVAQQFEVQLGKRLDAAVNRGELRWCINNRGVRWGRVLTSEAVQAPLNTADIRDLRLVAGDVLMCEGGEIGRAAVWHGELTEAYFLNTLHRLRPKGRYNPNLLVSFFERWATTGELSALVGKATLAHLTKENLLRVPLPVLPPEEQKRVVEALADVDSSAASLERLIRKKRAIKQGLMQELLTGRTRLPGFDADWSTQRLSMLGSFQRGRGIKRDEVRPSGVPCIRYGELYTTYVDYTSSTVSFVDQSVATTALPIRTGDVLFAGSGETKEEIGICVAYVGDAPAVSGGDIIVLRGANYDPVYLASLLNTPEVANQKARGGQGDAVVHINWRVLADIEVSLPERSEQAAIGRVIRDADAEIEALERRLQATRAVKQGMMQELLTGRTRLLGEGAA